MKPQFCLFVFLAVLVIFVNSATISSSYSPLILGTNKFILEFPEEAPKFFTYPKNRLGRVLRTVNVVVDLKEIRELRNCNPNDVIVSYPFAGIGFEMIEQNFTTIEGNVEPSLLIRKQFDNGATLNSFFYAFSHPTSFPIIPEYSLPVREDSMKFSFNLTDWPFASSNNCLNVFLDTYTTTDQIVNANLELGLYANVIHLVTNNLLVNVTIVNFAVVDDQTSFDIEWDSTPLFTPTFQWYGTSYVYLFQYFNKSLHYDPDLSILLYNEPDCSSTNDCNLHGTCIQTDTCQCDSGWSGDGCDVANCPGTPDCENKGQCVTSGISPYCSCDNGWRGSDCSIPDCPGSPDCNNHGLCKTDATIPYCSCFEGWFGNACSQSNCSESCNQRGTCSSLFENPTCVCDHGWSGPTCNTFIGNCTSNSQCNNGACDMSSGRCTCNNMFIGPYCNIAICPGYNETMNAGNCNYKGSCIATGQTPICNCYEYFGGSDCSKALCPGQNCSNNGDCIADTLTPSCSCDLGYTGEDCATADTNAKKEPTMKLAVGVSVGVVVFIGSAIIITGIVVQKKKKQTWRRKLNSFDVRDRGISMDVIVKDKSSSD